MDMHLLINIEPPPICGDSTQQQVVKRADVGNSHVPYSILDQTSVQ